MKTAEELKTLAKLKSSEQIAKALDGAKEHMIKRCQEEAEKGRYKYMFTSDGVHQFIIIDLLYEFLKILHEFEKNGYIVKILRDSTHQYYNYLNIYIWWDNNRSIGCNCSDSLYDTYNGINKKNIEIIKEENRYLWQ